MINLCERLAEDTYDLLLVLETGHQLLESVLIGFGLLTILDIKLQKLVNLEFHGSGGYILPPKRVLELFECFFAFVLKGLLCLVRQRRGPMRFSKYRSYGPINIVKFHGHFLDLSFQISA